MQIHAATQDPTFWVCLCGNRSLDEGFYPCDSWGNDLKSIADWTTGWYVCGRCGRIIDGRTLQVVGKKEGR